jgi:hypothetical protein
VSHDPSRKRFLTKMLGLAAVGALAPKAVAKALAPESTQVQGGKTVGFSIRPQPRAVARRG